MGGGVGGRGEGVVGEGCVRGHRPWPKRPLSSLFQNTIRLHTLEKNQPMPLENLPAEFLEECRCAMHAEQAQSLAASSNWAHVDRQKVHQDWDVLYKELVPMLDRERPEAPEVQALMAQHYAIVSRFYAPSSKAYVGMALFYQENDGMRDFHNAYHPSMVEFLGDAVHVFAKANL